MKIPDHKKIVFIDLDGTLIRPKSTKSFPSSILDFEIIRSTWDSLKEWVRNKKDNDGSCYIFIVTNQGGIELEPIYEISIVEKLRFISVALLEYIGYDCLGNVTIDFSYCLTNDEESEFRKPNSGMLDLLLDTYELSQVVKKRDMVMIGNDSGELGDVSSNDLNTADNFKIDYIDVRTLW